MLGEWESVRNLQLKKKNMTRRREKTTTTKQKKNVANGERIIRFEAQECAIDNHYPLNLNAVSSTPPFQKEMAERMGRPVLLQQTLPLRHARTAEAKL